MGEIVVMVDPRAPPGKVEKIAIATPLPYNKRWGVREVHGVSKKALDLRTVVVVQFKKSRSSNRGSLHFSSVAQR